MTEAPVLYYTRCPAPTPTGVGAGTGRLQQQLQALGIEPRALQDETDPELKRHHFEHGIGNLVRDGGNIPAIWARSHGADTRLLGLTWLDEFQAIAVHPDSALTSVAELEGRRIAISRTPGTRLDVARISAIRGVEQALSTVGKTLDAVTLIDIEHQPGGWKEHFDDELAALADGRIDAVWVKSAAGALAERSGQVRVLLRIDRLDDPLLRVNNGTPRTLTFHREFIDRHPEVVGAYLSGVSEAVAAAAGDRAGLFTLLSRETGQSPTDAELAFATFEPDDLVPSLTPGRIAALQNQADFLLRHDFIPHRVDVASWALDWPRK